MITDIGPLVVGQEASFYNPPGQLLHMRFSCKIISLFMDGGGKSSQQNVEGLKGSTERWGSTVRLRSMALSWTQTDLPSGELLKLQSVKVID